MNFLRKNKKEGGTKRKVLFHLKMGEIRVIYRLTP